MVTREERKSVYDFYGKQLGKARAEVYFPRLIVSQPVAALDAPRTAFCLSNYRFTP